MPEIFLSYKSERRNAARHLKKVLECYFQTSAEDVVWYDYELVPGHDFEPRILAEISCARVVIVLWCEMAVKSSWVHHEAREAQRTGKFLPVRIEACELPPEFAGADTVSLIEWDASPRSHLLDRLLDHVGRRIGRDAMVQISRLRELEDDWRGYGAPSLARFALGRTLVPDAGGHAFSSAQALEAHSPNPSANWDVTRRGSSGVLPKAVPHIHETGAGVPHQTTDSLLRGFVVAPHALDETCGAREPGEVEVGADRGSRAGRANVARAGQDSNSCRPDDEDEVVQLYQLVREGNADGQVALGLMYKDGRGGLPQDDCEAVRLFELAVNQGHVGGQAALGIMHRDGRGGLPQDDREAVRLVKLAADSGDAHGQVTLGLMYKTGDAGLSQDDREAFRLFKLAAENEDSAGQLFLGWMYYDGTGDLPWPQSQSEAARLFRLAADQGHAGAQRSLGWMYHDGRGGLPEDYSEAVRLFTLAADQGDVYGQAALASMYMYGRGVPRNDREAVRLCKLAARGGVRWATEQLKLRRETW